MKIKLVRTFKILIILPFAITGILGLCFLAIPFAVFEIIGDSLRSAND